MLIRDGQKGERKEGGPRGEEVSLVHSQKVSIESAVRIAQRRAKLAGHFHPVLLSP